MISAGERAGASVAQAPAPAPATDRRPARTRREASDAERQAAAGRGDQHLVAHLAVASCTKFSPLQCMGMTTSGSSAFTSADHLLEVIGRRGTEMEAADDGVHLLDARDLLRLPHRIDDADMAAGADDDEADSP